MRPAGDASDDAAKAAAEEAAKGGGGDTGSPPTQAEIDQKENLVFLEERFGVAFTSGLTADEAAEEADWHRREEAGFPTDRPSASLYAEHYRSRHPGVAVPQMPPQGVRSGQLDPSTVVALGLIPLTRTAPAGEERYYEPALVTEGSMVTARDGSIYRVTYADGRFLATPVGGSPGPSPSPSSQPQPSGGPQPTSVVPNMPTPNDLANARSGGRWQGGVWGILGGLALGVTATVLVVKFWPRSDKEDERRRGLPERENPARFRLFDNGGTSADRYTMLDARPVETDGQKWYSYYGFDENPTSPQGIGMSGELTSADWYNLSSTGFRRLGKRIGLEDLPAKLRSHIEAKIVEWEGDPKSALRGRNSQKARAARAK